MANFKTTSIDLVGHEFIITHWSPTKVMMNMPKIGRYFAVPMATVAGSLLSGAGNFSDALPTAALYLFDQMEEDDVMKLFDLILDGVDCDSMGGKIDIDEIFSEDVTALFTLVAKVLEVNYGCFFKKDGFASLQGLLEKMGMVQKVDQLDQKPAN